MNERESKSDSVLSDSLWPCGLYSPWNSPGKNTGVDNHSLLQGNFPTQGLNPNLPHCRWILSQLSHQVKPKDTGVGCQSLLQEICPNQELNWVSCIAGGFFTSWAIMEAQAINSRLQIDTLIFYRTCKITFVCMLSHLIMSDSLLPRGL